MSLPVPTEAIERITRLAAGDTGGSRAARKLLEWVVASDGACELRALDCDNRAAMLEIIKWWGGPIWSEDPLYEAIERHDLEIGNHMPADDDPPEKEAT